jgi:hypothetical protein
LPAKLVAVMPAPARSATENHCGQIAGVEEMLGELIMQARPFFPRILGRLPVEQVIHLTRVALDIVKLIFDLRRRG